MVRRQIDQLDASRVKKRAVADEESIEALARNGRERCIDLAIRVGLEQPDLQAHGAGRRLYVSDNRFCNHSIIWFDEQGNARCAGYHLVQKFQPLCGQFTSQPSKSQSDCPPGERGL